MFRLVGVLVLLTARKQRVVGLSSFFVLFGVFDFVRQMLFIIPAEDICVEDIQKEQDGWVQGEVADIMHKALMGGKV